MKILEKNNYKLVLFTSTIFIQVYFVIVSIVQIYYELRALTVKIRLLISFLY